jgi:hypothetical protein
MQIHDGTIVMQGIGIVSCFCATPFGTMVLVHRNMPWDDVKLQRCYRKKLMNPKFSVAT